MTDHSEGTLRNTYDSAKDSAADAVHKSAGAIESNPLGILVGGLAFGAVVGALIPRSDREKDMLAPLGKRLSETAVAAVAAAREAGMQELDNQGLTKSNAKDRGRDLLDGVLKAVTSAGGAAARTAKPN